MEKEIFFTQSMQTVDVLDVLENVVIKKHIGMLAQLNVKRIRRNDKFFNFQLNILHFTASIL